MHADLQAVFVGARCHFVELAGGEERQAARTRMVRIIIEHQGRHRFEHAIHEYLHPARIEHIVIVAPAHFKRFIDARRREIVLVVPRHLYPADEIAFLT